MEAGEMKIESIPYEPKSVVEGSLAAVRAGCDDKQLSLGIMEWHKHFPFRFLGDPNRVRQVLLNLLSNVILKFTKSGGSIRVHGKILTKDDDCDFLSKHHVMACDKHDERWIKISFVDTGAIGIRDDNQSLIFQKYHQENLTVARTHGGTGLGLSICQLLVQSMGGAIGVESQLGKGSEFWFILPVRLPQRKQSIAELEPVGEASAGSSKATAGMNILVAEDNVVNQKRITNMLNG